MEMCYQGTLAMPKSYAVMDQDEMMYVEGGAYISKTNCINGLAAAGITSPSIAIAGCVAAIAAKKFVKAALKFGGVAGWVASAICGWAASQIIAFVAGVARGAIHKGVYVTWNSNIFKGPIGVNCTVRF